MGKGEKKKRRVVEELIISMLDYVFHYVLKVLTGQREG